MSLLGELDEFAMVENYWHFDLLCKDLAKYKSLDRAVYKAVDLTPTPVKVNICTIFD
jgi:hypothetical protein